MRRRAFGLAPHASKLSRPFGVNPSRLRTCGAARSACLSCSEVRYRNGNAPTTPRLAAAGCAKACRPRRWQFAAWSSRRTVHRHAARPCLWSFHATPQARCRLRRQARSRPCPWWLALPASGRKPVKPSRGDAESAMSPFGGGRPVRPCLVVNPGGGAAAPWA